MVLRSYNGASFETLGKETMSLVVSKQATDETAESVKQHLECVHALSRFTEHLAGETESEMMRP